MENRPDSQKIDELTTEFHELRVALVGDPDMPGVKGAIQRLSDKFDELPCNDHTKRLIILETARTVNCAVKKERGRWVQNLLKVAKILIPVGAGGGIVAWLGDFFG